MKTLNIHAFAQTSRRRFFCTFVLFFGLAVFLGSCAQSTGGGGADSTAGGSASPVTTTSGSKRLASYKALWLRYDNAVGESSTFEYTDGNLSKMTQISYNPLTGETTSTKNVTFTHNSQNRITAQNNAVGYGWKYSYNASGQMVNSTFINNNTGSTSSREIKYASTGQVVSVGASPITYSGGKLSKYLTYTYTYNSKGLCQEFSVISPAVKATYTYDSDGYLLTRTFYDELGAAYTQKFAWEYGSTNFDFSDPVVSITYSMGWYDGYGLPW